MVFNSTFLKEESTFSAYVVCSVMGILITNRRSAVITWFVVRQWGEFLLDFVFGGTIFAKGY